MAESTAAKRRNPFAGESSTDWTARSAAHDEALRRGRPEKPTTTGRRLEASERARGIVITFADRLRDALDAADGDKIVAFMIMVDSAERGEWIPGDNQVQDLKRLLGEGLNAAISSDTLYRYTSGFDLRCRVAATRAMSFPSGMEYRIADMTGILTRAAEEAAKRPPRDGRTNPFEYPSARFNVALDEANGDKLNAARVLIEQLRKREWLPTPEEVRALRALTIKGAEERVAQMGGRHVRIGSVYANRIRFERKTAKPEDTSSEGGDTSGVAQTSERPATPFGPKPPRTPNVA